LAHGAICVIGSAHLLFGKAGAYRHAATYDSYDFQPYFDTILALGADAHIPPRALGIESHTFAPHINKGRNLLKKSGSPTEPIIPPESQHVAARRIDVARRLSPWPESGSLNFLRQPRSATMQEKPVVSSNPVSLTTGNGKQLLIPLSALYFDSAGEVKADRWPLYQDNQSLVDPFLQRLLDSQSIQAGPVPAAKPALKATAVTAGATGILIELEISNVTPNSATPPASTLDAKVTETDAYKGTTLTKLAEKLGSAAGIGKQPGLVFVKNAQELPNEGQYSLAIGNPGDPAKFDVPKDGGAGTAFTLEARSDDPDGARIKAQIENLDVAAQTFDLTVSWSKSVTAKAVSAIAPDFAFVVKIEAPDGGYRAPASGRIALVGGTDALSVTAVPASTVVLTS